MESEFKVQVGQFEGPLELLLDLVEKRKLHISDISLSQVADEFIEYVKSFEEFPVQDSADFILIASTLLLIKSKSLLPNMPLTEEEEVSIEDLENRLAAYKRYKELAAGLQKIFGNFLYFGGERKETRIVFSPTPDITLGSLKAAFSEALRNMPKPEEELPKVKVENIVSLEEMIDRLSEKIEKSLKTSFKEFSNMEKMDRVNVIVSFLAMLELVKQGAVRVSQQNHFADIEIESESVSVPTYN